MSKTIKRLFVVVVGFLLATTAMAQSTTSSIAGHVADTNGPLHDAMVTAIYTPTGLAYHAFSNRDGAFRINGVVAGGPYTIKVEMMGHQTLVINKIYAPLASTVVIEPRLKVVANTLDEVVISAEGIDNNMRIENAGAGTHIGTLTIEEMPTTDRSMNDVMKLTPQAAVVGGGFAAGGGNYRGSAVTVDGAAFNNAFGIGSNLPAGGSPISLDAIDQITINLTPYDVRQSGFQGSAINVVTKQGSNQWHGSVYNYATGSFARGTKVEDYDLANNYTLNNAMGFTLSGPIVKDKLFFFLNGEYTIDNVEGSSRQARESETDEYGGSTSYNRPTVEQMEQMRQFLIDNYQYDPGRYQGYSLSTPDYKILARLDWNINSNNKFNLRFSHTHTYASNPPSSSMSPIGGTTTRFKIGDEPYQFNRNTEGRQSDYALYYESARYYQEQNFTSLAAELNSRLFGGKGANTLRATWSLQNEPRSFEGDLFPTVDILEPYVVDGKTNYALFTTFGIDPFTYNNLRRVNTFNVTDELSYVAGRHNITGGIQFEFNRIVNGFMQGGAGWYLYDSWNSFATGADPLSFMITHANLDDPTATVFPTYDYMQGSIYGQDEIEFSQYFKLTAGLRLEVPIIHFPNNNLNKDFEAIAKDHPESSFAGLSTADLPNTSVNISPRLGFNWDVAKNRKVVVRGGTGLFTGRIPNVWLVSAAGNSNVLQYQYIANITTGADVVSFNSDRNAIINSLYPEDKPFEQQDLAAPTSTTILAKDLRMPTSWKSSAAVDVRLPLGIKATLEGLYSYNYNEVVATTLGYKLGDSVMLPGEPEKRPTYLSEGIKNMNGSNMSGYYLHNAKDLHGQYWSITAQLQKNFLFGLDLMAAYTHSFSLSATDGAGDQVYNIAQISNVNGDNSHELGYSYYVTPNRLIANASHTIYEGPHTATKLGLFYEGTNICYVGIYNQARHSYLMTTDQATGISTSQLVYIPTQEELAKMPFSSDENRAAYEEFISNDPYLSAHRGEYSKRNGAVAPWLNRFNFKVSQEFYFNVHGRKTTLDVGADVNNLLNLFNSGWGNYKQISSETILNYKDGAYTFTEPSWHSYNNLYSTWSLLLHVRYSF